jgi:hypothetical protein
VWWLGVGFHCHNILNFYLRTLWRDIYVRTPNVLAGAIGQSAGAFVVVRRRLSLSQHHKSGHLWCSSAGFHSNFPHYTTSTPPGSHLWSPPRLCASAREKGVNSPRAFSRKQGGPLFCNLLSDIPLNRDKVYLFLFFQYFLGMGINVPNPFRRGHFLSGLIDFIPYYVNLKFNIGGFCHIK